jgi:hypothetical protein
MGVTLQDLAQGALDLGHIIQKGMTGIDAATGANTAKPATTASGAQPTAPAATANKAATQSSSGAAALPAWVFPVGLAVVLLWWKPWRAL